MSSLGSIDFLLDDFAKYNDQVAIIWKDESFSYKNILQRIHKWRHELTDLQSGAIVGLEGDFCAAFGRRADLFFLVAFCF